MTGYQQKLKRYPMLLACFAGMGLCVLMLALSSAALIFQQMRDASAAQVKLSALALSAVEQSRGLAVRLQRDFMPDCTPANLAALNSLLFEYRFLKDVELYNKDNKVYCTAGLGRLPQPVETAPTLYIDKYGGQVWFNAPALIGRGKIATIMVRTGDGRFNTLFEPGVVNEVIKASDVMWFGKVGKPTHVNPDMSSDLLAAVMEIDKTGQEGWHFLWRHGAIVSVLKVPTTAIRFAHVAYLRDAYTRQPASTLLLLTLSLVLGTITAVWGHTLLLRMASIDYRLSKLLVAQHVICMYQPIIELASGRPVGCEVLVRLQEEGHLISPADFIPAVRAQNLNWQLDQAVLQEGMRELSVVTSHIKGFKVAFNLFPESIHFALVHQLLKPYAEILAEHGVKVCLEVTEYHFSDALIPELREFVQAGYQISVDDFGTGYSNLNTVKKVAPHTLKIDQSFVYEMEDASVRSSLIPEIVAIAHAVEAEVVAEGIENAAQAEKLQALGVRYGQGYYYARPMLLGDFVAYVDGFFKPRR